MFNQTGSPSRLYVEVAILITTWIALILQLYLNTGSIANFFSFFTILSNLMVALNLSASFIPGKNIFKEMCEKITVKTAIALYILVVGLIYNSVLRATWQPHGLQLVADNLLHVVVPFSYVMYWIVSVPKAALSWTGALKWGIFPLAYLIYSILRGSMISWYPYPFLNVDTLGYKQVILNSFFILLVFVFLAVLFVLGDRYLKGGSPTNDEQ